MADITQHDERHRHCPMLGHEIAFRYCREPGRKVPCKKIFDCWWREFEVQEFVQEHFSQQDVEEILTPRQDKMFSLVQLIEQARQRQEQDSTDSQGEPDKGS